MKAPSPMTVRCLRDAVEVAGDRAGADVDVVAHVRVADVAEVAHLRAAAQSRVLHLGEVADVDAAADVGAAAQVAERPNAHVVLQRRLLDDGRDDATAVADRGVDDAAVRPDLAVLADGASCREGDVFGWSVVSTPIVTSASMYVVAGSTRVTPASMCRCRMRSRMIGLRLRQLDAVVDAQRLGRVGDGHGYDLRAFARRPCR